MDIDGSRPPSLATPRRPSPPLNFTISTQYVCDGTNKNPGRNEANAAKRTGFLADEHNLLSLMKAKSEGTAASGQAESSSSAVRATAGGISLETIQHSHTH
jgi:hypothetical protein